MSIFGFSTEAPTGDFTPIIKYDARAGRIFRVDRIDTGNGFEANPVDITNSFKAVCDFENIETGWIDFSSGGAPSFVLVPRGQMLPPKPSTVHKNGIRFMVKLNKDCGGDKPVREIAGTSRAFLNGTQAVVEQWLREAATKPAGQLPVIVLEKTTPVKTGSGDKSSTNYHPTWKIVGWVPRPADLQPKAAAAPQAQANGSGQQQSSAAPSTGSQRPQNPPQQPQQASQTVSPDDFG